MNEGTTHHVNCWRDHPKCAQARMQEIEKYITQHGHMMHGDPVGWWWEFWKVFRGERKG